MYLTIHEMKLRDQETAVRGLAAEYLSLMADVANVVRQIEGDWRGEGANAQIKKLKEAVKQMGETRKQLLNTASLLDQYCEQHRTIWEELEEAVEDWVT